MRPFVTLRSPTYQRVARRSFATLLAPRLVEHTPKALIASHTFSRCHGRAASSWLLGARETHVKPACESLHRLPRKRAAL
jgi:hypothetical protein